MNQQSYRVGYASFLALLVSVLVPNTDALAQQNGFSNSQFSRDLAGTSSEPMRITSQGSSSSAQTIPSLEQISRQSSQQWTSTQQQVLSPPRVSSAQTSSTGNEVIMNPYNTQLQPNSQYSVVPQQYQSAQVQQQFYQVQQPAQANTQQYQVQQALPAQQQFYQVQQPVRVRPQQYQIQQALPAQQQFYRAQQPVQVNAFQAQASSQQPVVRQAVSGQQLYAPVQTIAYPVQQPEQVVPRSFSSDEKSTVTFLNGLYIGISYAFDSYSPGDVIYDMNNGAEIIEGPEMDRKTTSSIGGYIGYRQPVGNGLTFGVEGYFEKTLNVISARALTADFTDFGVDIGPTFRIGALAKAGILLTEDTLAYIGAGIEHSRFNSKGVGANTIENTSKTGLRVVAGIEQKITDAVSMRGEVGYRKYSALKADGNLFDLTVDDVSSFSVGVGLTYNLGG